MTIRTHMHKGVMMRKLILLLLISFSFFQITALAQRAPAVEPVTEIATDDLRHPAPADAVGFNFSQTETTTATSTIITMAFLLGLPVMIWFSISRGMKRRKSKRDEIVHDNVTQFPTRDRKEEKKDYKRAS